MILKHLQQVYLVIWYCQNNIIMFRQVLLLEQVRLDDWVQNLPKGMDTEMGEAGSTLSGGQKQRVGIARALYKQPDLLFLDEATSSLDRSTEQEINKAISRLKQVFPGLTVLSIAHRESSLAFCERIVKIENKDE